MKFSIWSCVITVATIGICSNAALAAQLLTIETDKSQMISLSVAPSTVVIGNPSIADVTLNGKQVFIHGHAFGETNLMILDASGNQIASFDLVVAHTGESSLVMFEAGSRYSYTCAPLCDVSMQPGDNFDWTGKVIGTHQSKNAFATGKSSAEASPPKAAPQ